MKNKKIIIWLIILLLIIGVLVILSFYKKENSYTKSLFKMKPYNKIVLEDIKSITMTKYTEGGSESTLYDLKKDIEYTYNQLKETKVGKETDMACDDNTTIYTFTLKNDEEISIEFECDWLVTQNKRYLIKK